MRIFSKRYKQHNAYKENFKHKEIDSIPKGSLTGRKRDYLRWKLMTADESFLSVDET